MGSWCRLAPPNNSGHQAAGAARRTKRQGSDGERRSICLQTAAPAVAVVRVALGNTVTANLKFNWLPGPRDRPRPGTGSADAGLRLLPVESVKQSPVTRLTTAAESHNGFALAGAYRMRIGGSGDPDCRHG